MFFRAVATEPLLAEAKGEGLGVHVRSLVGLERDAARQAFSCLLQGSTATANEAELVLNRGDPVGWLVEGGHDGGSCR